MSLQHTMLSSFLPLVIALLFVSSGTVVGGEQRVDTVLSRLGIDVRTLIIEGALSTTGEQSMSGIPFEVIVEEDTMRMTTSGPFGIVAARIFAQPDSFVVVNYFMREVFDGDPSSSTLAQAMPIPLTVTDLQMLVRGRLPGDLTRFVRGERRKDSSVLFIARRTDGVEYALVDTASGILRQYQRKNLDGQLVMNITFSDVRTVSGLGIPHAIDVAFDDRKQTVSFRFTKVTANEPITSSFDVQIPASFTRKTYR